MTQPHKSHNSTIQVISGTFARRRLFTPVGATTRPTTSQMRQAVFNICQNEVEDSKFLDICAGSGSMGIEALSRGAASVTFIDNDNVAIDSIHKNITLLGLEALARVVTGDAVECLEKLEKQQKTFTLCYFDPPYTQTKENSPFSVAVLKYLDTSTLLAYDSYVLMEESKFFSLDVLGLKTLTLKSKRSFGNSFLYCLVRHKAES